MARFGLILVLLAMVGAAYSQVERKALCVLQPQAPNSQNVSGTIELTQLWIDEPVNIGGIITVSTEDDVSGLHGFHIHEFGVSSGDCVEAAGHYNPFGNDHGAPERENRHVGDLGNIMMTKVEDGIYNSLVQISDNQVTLFGEYSVVGRGIVLHADPDDLGLGGEDDSLTTGHAGARIACCTIYMEE